MDDTFLPLDKQGHPIQVLSFGDTQNIDGTNTPTSSEIIDTEYIRTVRLAAIGDIWVKIGLNPTAIIGDSTFFPNGIVEYVAIPHNHKLSVAGGVLNITKTGQR